MKDIRKYKKGDIISKEGEFELWMYYLLYGSVGIYADYGTEQEVLLSIENAPSFFGEIGCIESLPRYGTSIALEDVTVEVINYDDLSEYFKNNPAKIMSILQGECERMRNLFKEYAKACHTMEDVLTALENKEEIKSETKDEMEKLARASRNIKIKRNRLAEFLKKR